MCHWRIERQNAVRTKMRQKFALAGKTNRKRSEEVENWVTDFWIEKYMKCVNWGCLELLLSFLESDVPILKGLSNLSRFQNRYLVMTPILVLPSIFHTTRSREQLGWKFRKKLSLKVKRPFQRNIFGVWFEDYRRLQVFRKKHVLGCVRDFISST